MNNVIEKNGEVCLGEKILREGTKNRRTWAKSGELVIQFTVKMAGNSMKRVLKIEPWRTAANFGEFGRTLPNIFVT